LSGLTFKCLQCGSCCKGLLSDLNLPKRGLTLTANESKLFPKELISPQMAIGTRKPETIILYQLNVNDCPFLDANNKCKIYAKRPLICRSFPLTLSMGYSTKCNLFSFARNAPDNQIKLVIDWDSSQMEACLKLDRYIMNRFHREFKKGIGTWAFDLETNEWKLRNRYYSKTDVISF
jgi:Fe-S-cluster containining protein